METSTRALGKITSTQLSFAMLCITNILSFFNLSTFLKKRLLTPDTTTNQKM